MNHEQPKHHSEREPLIGDHFINHLIETAPNAEAAERIRDAYEYHGTSMAAFLGLDDIDPYCEHIVLDFLNCYHGKYVRMSDLVDEVIEERGWLQTLEKVYEEHPELEFLLTLDREGVRDLVEMRYDVVDLGELYVFEK
jgi:hypothetical protein